MLRYKNLLAIILLSLIYLNARSQGFGFTGIDTAKTAPFSIGETKIIFSNRLQEFRTLNIYLPEGYNPKDTTKYPVIYLLDGSKDEDFIHVAGLTQYLSFSWINELKPSIVVGIANKDRKKDFTFPTTVKKDKEDYPTTGSSANFIEFIKTELQPYVDSVYKTASEKTIIGQSLGGLLATEILFKQPQLFANYIIVSPSLWWDNESLLKIKPNFSQNTSKKISVHVSVGKEGTTMINDAKSLCAKLSSIKQINRAFRYYSEMKHETIYHIAVYNALGWINRKK